MNHKAYYSDINTGSFDLPINKHFVFFTGLGFDWQKYKFKGNVSLRNDENGVTQFIFDNDRNYRSSRFRIYHMVMPLIFEYQTGSRRFKDFFVQAGVEVLIKTSASTKIEVQTDNGIKTERHRGLNANTLNARLMLRTGLNDFSFMAFFQPVSIFKSDYGPNIKPYGIGVMLNF
jgi:hypothetical protein